MYNRLKKILLIALVCVTVIGSTFSIPISSDAAGAATVNLTAVKQEIRGFGGINFPSWQKPALDMTEEQRETAFDNGDNQLGFSVLRIHVDPDKEKWSEELDTAKAAIAHGAIVFASPWDPPANMIEKANGKNHLKTSMYADYAKHLNDFVAYMKENGVELYAISVQNEPDWAEGWTAWSSAEILNFMKNYAGTINCRVIAPESFQYKKDMSDPILNDAKALANMDILGAHLYGVDNPAAYPLFKQKGAGKELWMTEVYYPNSSSQADTWPEALETAHHIHKSLVDAEFQAYVWWYIRRYYGPIKEDGTVSKRGYMMGHYSKFVRNGYVRVDATSSPTTNVFVSAYKGDNKAVIVAINKGASQVSQAFNIQGGTPTEASSWTTTGTKNMAKGSPISVSNGAFTATLPAQSVTTFVMELGPKATPTPVPTPTSANTPTPVITVDVNHDGAVNMQDVMLIASAFNSVKGDSKYVRIYDLNSDGAINMTDVMRIAEKFNTTV